MNGMRKSSKMRAALLLACMGSSVLAAAAENVVTLDVQPPQAMQSGALPACPPMPVADCALPWPDAFVLVQSEEWQRTLPAGIDTVRLRLPDGSFRIEQALVLRWGKGLEHDVRLEISGRPGGTVLSGATIVDQWTAVSAADIPARLKAQVQPQVFSASISALPLPFNQIPRGRGYGIAPQPALTEVFVNDTPQPIAAWPNAGYGALAVPAGVPAGDSRMFAVAGREASDWQDEPDLMAHAFWKYDWAAQAYLVSDKDAANNRLQLIGNGSPYGIAAGQRVRMENALAELDAPGEWYVDRASKTLYFLPQGAGEPVNVELSVAATLLRIEDSRNVSLSGIRFEKSRGDAIVVRGSSNVVFDRVKVHNAGNRALVMTDSPASGMRDSLIENSGEGGVLIIGGDRRTLIPSRNFIENSTIRRFSRRVKTMGFAVELQGVGHRIAGNTISQAPHSAIFFSGNDHLIENNVIFSVATETSDAGAIYVGRDFTVQGNEIRGNLLRDIQPYAPNREVKGVYIDDQASGIAVRNNIFARVQQPVFIGGGRDNVVEYNLFYHSSPALHLDARGVEGQKAQTIDPAGTLLKRLEAVPYRGALYASRFPNLPRIREDDFGLPKYNAFRENTLIESSGPSVAERAQAGIAIGGNRTLDESAFLFAKPPSARRDRDDFRLHEVFGGFAQPE